MADLYLVGYQMLLLWHGKYKYHTIEKWCSVCLNLVFYDYFVFSLSLDPCFPFYTTVAFKSYIHVPPTLSYMRDLLASS